MFVSKKGFRGLSLIGLYPAELEAGGKRTAETPQSFQSALLAVVTLDHELALARNAHFNLVAIFEVKRLDDGARQANGKTVSPL